MPSSISIDHWFRPELPSSLESCSARLGWGPAERTRRCAQERRDLRARIADVDAKLDMTMPPTHS
jgi:hypothetical protein